ncbi:hypothetical protein N7U49_34595 [Streptomyces sp. AD2-2]|nr:hypothetical protein N7U49_34595 [Streptomyces sp. AD2-2]
MAGRIARWGLAPVLGAVWWWAVLRLALTPHAGALEGAVAAGGWGLSLLPVHCMPKARAAGAVAAGRWREAWRGLGAVWCGGGDAGSGSEGRGRVAGSRCVGCRGDFGPRSDGRRGVGGR